MVKTEELEEKRRVEELEREARRKERRTGKEAISPAGGLDTTGSGKGEEETVEKCGEEGVEKKGRLRTAQGS